MAKKFYQAPQADVLQLCPQGIICGSLDGNGGSLTIDPVFDPWSAGVPDFLF